MPHFIRIAQNLDAAPLLAELDAAPEMWLANTSRQRNIRCQRNTMSIFLRSPKKPLPPGETDSKNVHESRIGPSAQKFPHALRFCEIVADVVNGDLARASLVVLTPQSEVYRHFDAGEYYRIRDRFHFVVQSEQGSHLTAGDESVVMQEGELWVFNNKEHHTAYNPSDLPRVHLIFDILPSAGFGYFTLDRDGCLEYRNSAAPTQEEIAVELRRRLPKAPIHLAQTNVHA